jgi:hypothetical protein
VNAHTKRDITGGLALCALALAYLWGATLIPQSTLSDEVGARGLPFALGFLLALVGAAIAVKAWLARTGTHREESAEGGASLRRVLGLLACVALYVLVAWLVGYIIASAVLLLAVSLYEDAPLNLRTFGVAGAGAIVFWLIFVKFLNVEQPIGKLLAGSCLEPCWFQQRSSGLSGASSAARCRGFRPPSRWRWCCRSPMAWSR